MVKKMVERIAVKEGMLKLSIIPKNRDKVSTDSRKRLDNSFQSVGDAFAKVGKSIERAER